MNREDYESNQDWYAKYRELEEKYDKLVDEGFEAVGIISAEVRELENFISYLFDLQLVLGHDREDHWNEFKQSSSNNVDVSPDNKENQ